MSGGTGGRIDGVIVQRRDLIVHFHFGHRTHKLGQ
jgi:hypothetical protein